MGKPKVTEGIFNAVKLLTNGGASVDEIAEYLSISPATVSRIRSSQNMDEYKNAAIAAYMNYRHKTKKPEPPAVEETPKVSGMSGNYQMNRVIELLKAQNETLTLISNKLAFIVDELTK